MRQLKITKQFTQRTELSINRYFQEITRYSILTAEEEVELSVRIRKGDEKALEELVTSNLRFVISVAKQYQNQGLSFSDLINEGNFGLVKAAKRFDETKGFKFISYAVWWIRQSIIQAIAQQTRMIRLPLNKVASIRKITKSISYLEQQYEREPTDDEIAGYLDLASDKIEFSKHLQQPHLSFDLPLSEDEEDDSNLYNFVWDKEIPSPDDNLMQESLEENISRALKKLTKREANIMSMYFGLGGTPAYSLNRIALKLNMSSERVRQVKGRGLMKLKDLLNGNEIFME
jgi:RNA polymerase primary sigma factor